MRKRVNEVPSLVSFKRQAALRTGMQHRTRTPLTTIGIKVNTLCCIAKAKPDFDRSQGAIEPATRLGESRAPRAEAFDSGEKGPEFRHVTTLRVNALFHPRKRTTAPAHGAHRYTRQLFDKDGPLQSLPTKL
jgi:hypothetical protein